jgi:hypothetical protein
MIYPQKARLVIGQVFGVGKQSEECCDWFFVGKSQIFNCGRLGVAHGCIGVAYFDFCCHWRFKMGVLKSAYLPFSSEFRYLVQ